MLSTDKVMSCSPCSIPRKMLTDTRTGIDCEVGVSKHCSGGGGGGVVLNSVVVCSAVFSSVVVSCAVGAAWPRQESNANL